MKTQYISAQEAADILGKSRRRINQLVESGELVGELMGNSNMIERASVVAAKKRDDKTHNGSKKAKK